MEWGGGDGGDGDPSLQGSFNRGHPPVGSEGIEFCGAARAARRKEW